MAHPRSPEVLTVSRSQDTRRLHSIGTHTSLDETGMEYGIILQNFNSLRDNIDPTTLLTKLYDAEFLERDSVYFLNSHTRSITSMQVMIAVSKKIRIPGSFIAFKDILTNHNNFCATILERHDSTASSSEERQDNHEHHESVLLRERSSIEEGLEKLQTEKLLNIIGTFVEKLIFSLNDIEEIMSYIIAGDKRRSASLLLEKIIGYIRKGSFRCFINGLQNYTGNNYMSIIRKELTRHLQRDEVLEGHKTSTSQKMEEAHNIVAQKVAGKLPLALEEKGFKVLQIEKGSIVIHLKCAQKMNRKDVNREFFKKEGILESLIPVLHDKEIKELCPGISFVVVGCDIIVRAEETGDEKHLPLTVIEANKSFLIEEIDTGTLLAAFQKRGIDCFERNGLDLHANRRTRATKFLEIVDSENKTNLLLDILKEQEMEHIYERLTTYELISKTGVDTSILETSLYSELQQLTRLLEVDDIEDVVVDRQILDQKIFDEIIETFGDKSVAVMLLKIISSGKMAMLTLVELLYLKQEFTLADGFLASASVENGKQEAQNINGVTSGCNCQTTGTEFVLTIHIVDIKGMDLQKTDVIIQNNTFVSTTDTDTIKHGISLQKTDAIIHRKTIVPIHDNVFYDKRKHGISLQKTDAIIQRNTVVPLHDNVFYDQKKHGIGLQKTDVIIPTNTTDFFYNRSLGLQKTEAIIFPIQKNFLYDRKKHVRGQVSLNHRKRYAISAENQDALIEKISELSYEGQCFYDRKEINLSGCVIDLKRNVMFYDGRAIYRGNCKVLQYALQCFDGVASWYEDQGDSPIIYLQTKTLMEK